MRAIAHERRRFGYWHLHVLLKREGYLINHKKLFRLYQEERLAVRRRGGRKRAIGTRAPITVTVAPNDRWSPDFVRISSPMTAASASSPSSMIAPASAIGAVTASFENSSTTPLMPRAAKTHSLPNPLRSPYPSICRPSASWFKRHLLGRMPPEIPARVAGEGELGKLWRRLQMYGQQIHLLRARLIGAYNMWR